MNNNNNNKNMLMEDPRTRSTMLFPGSSENSSSNISSILNFNPNVNAMLQAKQEEPGGGGSLELMATDSDGSLGRKRRQEQQEVSQMGSYLLQSSTAGSLPASHASNPATFWMVAGHGNQGMNSGGGGGGNGGDPIWAIPSVGNSGVYRGAMSGGIHFMNFASPMPLMPGGTLGSGMVGGGGGGGGGAAAMLTESNLGMLAALNAYRQIPANGVSDSPASTGQHHGGDDGHETNSQHS